MADFGDVLSGAGSGAMAGASFGPWGMAIGAVGGGLISAFSKKQKQQEYHNPYALQINAGIDRLMTSTTGLKLAQQQAGVIRKQADDTYDRVAADPGLAQNAAARTAAFNKIQGQSENSVIGAQLLGAQHDEEAQSKGLGMKMQQSQQDQQIFDYNQKIRNDNNKPGPFQTLLMNGIGSLAGGGLSKLVSGETFGGGDGSPTGNASSPGAMSAAGTYTPQLQAGPAYTPPAPPTPPRATANAWPNWSLWDPNSYAATQ